MRRVLIDTHIFLWSLYDSNRIKESHKEILMDNEVKILVSKASLFEISIKRSIGKLKLPHTVEEMLNISGFKVLSIEFNHLDKLKEREWFHKDPFDKMIISQAIADDLDLISYDGLFVKYPVKLI